MSKTSFTHSLNRHTPLKSHIIEGKALNHLSSMLEKFIGTLSYCCSAWSSSSSIKSTLAHLGCIYGRFHMEGMSHANEPKKNWPDTTWFGHVWNRKEVEDIIIVLWILHMLVERLVCWLSIWTFGLICFCFDKPVFFFVNHPFELIYIFL